MVELVDHVTGYAPVAGGRLYYEMAGSGPALVLTHAGLAHSPMWDPQFAVFAEQYRVIRYDMRGFGQSSDSEIPFAYYQDLHDLLVHLDIAHAHVLGLSLGGLVTLSFVIAYPAMVDGLILAATRLGHEPPSAYLEQGWALVEEAEEDDDIEEAVELELQIWVDGPHRTPEQVAPAVREFIRETNTETYIRAEGVGQPQPLEPLARTRLDEIQRPTLLIAGDSDVPDVLTSTDYMAQRIAGAQTVIIPGAAHMVNMEQPAAFNEAVLSFLSRLTPHS
jgi:pimeloyl-ACP methyl ester carboxylesterase